MSKIFLIFAVISYSISKVQSFKKLIDEKFTDSYIMPHLISVGSYIIKIDTSAITNGVDKVVDSAKSSKIIEDTKNSIKQSVESTTNSVKEAVQEEVINKVEEKIEETKTQTDEQIDNTKEKLKSIANKPQN